jgi:hypothetical protein
VITIDGLLGACPAGGEILRGDSGQLLGDGHGNQYPGGVHPFSSTPFFIRASTEPNCVIVHSSTERV